MLQGARAKEDPDAEDQEDPRGRVPLVKRFPFSEAKYLEDTNECLDIWRMGKDARSLSAREQETLRRRVVAAVSESMTHAAAAQKFGIARPTVTKWVSKQERYGPDALATRPRGRRRGTGRITSSVASWVVSTLKVERANPHQPSTDPQLPWTRARIRRLIRQRGLFVSVWTVGRWLQKRGIRLR